MATQPKGWRKASSAFLALQLRLFAAFQLAVGAGFIASACVLVFPSFGSGLAIALWAVGILAIVASLFGFVAASPSRISCCLSPYITLVFLLICAQAGLALYLFISPGKAASNVANAWTSSHPDEVAPIDKIQTAIEITRWVILGLLGAQILAILLALMLRCCARPGSYEPFEEGLQYRERAVANDAKLAQLKADVAAAEIALAEKKNDSKDGSPPQEASSFRIKTFRPSSTATVDLEAGNSKPGPSSGASRKKGGEAGKAGFKPTWASSSTPSKK